MTTFSRPIQKTKGHCSICQIKFKKDMFGLDDWVHADYNGQPICRKCKSKEQELGL